MFEKPAVPFDGRVGEIIQNVKDLTRLDTEYVLIAPFPSATGFLEMKY